MGFAGGRRLGAGVRRRGVCRRLWADERGQEGSFGAVFAVLVVVVIVGLVVWFGRVSNTETRLVNAARDAARAASLSRSEAAGREVATSVGAEHLAALGCAEAPTPRVEVVGDTWDGAVVWVELACTLDNSRLAGLSVLPGRQSFRAVGREVVGRYVEIG